MTGRPGRALLAALLLGAAALPARAVRPIKLPAPEFPEGAAWINSKPFAMRALRNRRVVLVTFVNFYSINSIRTLAWLNRLWDQYALRGLMIIGVHAPDFEFDRDPGELRHAAGRFGVRFPVFVDSGRKVWEAYRNDGWPAHYLVDHQGRVIHDWLGEGGYADFEREVLLALDAMGAKLPKNAEVTPDPKRLECGQATKGFYLGSRRGKQLLKIEPARVRAITQGRDGEAAVGGNWEAESELARFGGDKERLSSRLRVIYQGAEALAVLSRLGRRPVRVYLKQDGAWLHSGNANTDVQWDDDDRSYALVDHPRLYYLTRNQRPRLFELELFPDEAGAGVASFEFSDYCQTEYEHK